MTTEPKPHERLRLDVAMIQSFNIQSFNPNIATVYSKPERRYINDLATDLRALLDERDQLEGERDHAKELLRHRETYVDEQFQAAEAEVERLKAEVELVEAALRTAYEQGCIDTHNAIQAEPELALMAVESAEFGEAANDYAAQALADFQRGRG